MDKILLYFSLKYHGNWDKIYKALELKEKISPLELGEVEQKIKCNYITILDDEYPNTLRTSYKPPFVLFCKGNTKLLKNFYNTTSICGNGNININLQLDNYYKKAKGLEQERVLATYFESGVQEAIVDYCYDNQKNIICLLTSGFKETMEAHKELVTKCESENLLVLSEFYDDYYKNDDISTFSLRILSGLTENQVFIQNDLADETMKIVEYTINNGNDIYNIKLDNTTKMMQDLVKKENIIECDNLAQVLEKNKTINESKNNNERTR